MPLRKLSITHFITHQITNIGLEGFASLGKKIDDSLLTASRGGVITITNM